MSGETAGWDGILDEGETILWQGRPDGAVVWADMISVTSLFGFFFGGFAIFWVAAAAVMTTFGGGLSLLHLFPLFGVPFVLVGLYMMVGRLFHDAWRRRRTWYSLSDRTAYVATKGFRARRLDRYPISAETRLALDDATPGNVWFGEKVAYTRGGSVGTGGGRHYRPARTDVTPIGFRRIAEARKVYRLMVSAQAALTKAAAED